MMLHLSGSLAGKSVNWPLEAGTLVLGRSSRHPISLPDGTVSKDHAEVTVKQDGVWVRDLGSRNGTRLNGKEVHEAVAMRSGDVLEIGGVRLDVSEGEPKTRPRFNEATVVGSTKRVLVREVLERESSSGAGPSHMVRLLAEAGKLLILPRPLPETCDEILAVAERVMPASRYVILLREEGTGEPIQIAARARGVRADTPLSLSTTIMRTVLEDCASVLMGGGGSGDHLRANASIVQQQIQSAMAVPLFDNEKVLGLLYVDSQDFRVTFREEQLELLSLLANMAAVKITNSRLLQADEARARMAQDLATAARIQRGLLPASPPKAPGYAFEAYLESCFEVGGDLYDYHVRPDGRIIFLLGDVSGKGMGAALLSSSFLASMRALYDAHTDLAQIANRLAGLVAPTGDTGRFVTAILGCLDPATGSLQYVNAGHPLPMLVRGGEILELPGGGPPFGVLPGFAFTADTAEMLPGDMLAIFSDGVTEAQRGEEMFDEVQLRPTLLEASRCGSLAASRDLVVQKVDSFLAGAHRADDLTLLLMARDPSAS